MIAGVLVQILWVVAQVYEKSHLKSLVADAYDAWRSLKIIGITSVW